MHDGVLRGDRPRHVDRQIQQRGPPSPRPRRPNRRADSRPGAVGAAGRYRDRLDAAGSRGQAASRRHASALHRRADRAPWRVSRRRHRARLEGPQPVPPFPSRSRSRSPDDRPRAAFGLRRRRRCPAVPASAVVVDSAFPRPAHEPGRHPRSPAPLAARSGDQRRNRRGGAVWPSEKPRRTPRSMPGKTQPIKSN